MEYQQAGEEAILDPLHCDLRHQGQIVDEETGLYYNRHRYYDPQICQYLSPDSIGLAGGTRPQAYVHNPLEWVDPFGLAGCSLNPEDIHYMQNSIKNQTGSSTVLDNAIALKNGTLQAAGLPVIKVWQDATGKIWILDHRRLAAFKLAGLDSIPVQWATDKEVTEQIWKMSTRTEGKVLF